MLLLMALLQRWQLDMLVHMDRVLMRVPSVKIPVQGQRIRELIGITDAMCIEMGRAMQLRCWPAFKEKLLGNLNIKVCTGGLGGKKACAHEKCALLVQPLVDKCLSETTSMQAVWRTECMLLLLVN